MNGDQSELRVREADLADDEALIKLWRVCDLTKPWNPPREDIERLRASGHGTLLVGCGSDGNVICSVMVGHDGHRGWLYYLAVDPDMRRRGYGRRMIAEAENWLSKQNLPKCMLMVRAGSHLAERFYRSIGYELGPINVFQRWLKPQQQTDQSGKRDVTVTYLEMNSRPVRREISTPSMPHAILRAHDPDPNFYRYMHDTIGRQWLWYERRMLARSDLIKIIHDPAVEIFVLHVRGNPAGFVEIDRRAAPIADIRFMGLMPNFIGHGLGRYLLRWSIDQAWVGATDQVTVNTCTSDHPRALAMYQRAGFDPVRRITKVIEDPEPVIRRQEIAALMEDLAEE